MSSQCCSILKLNGIVEYSVCNLYLGVVVVGCRLRDIKNDGKLDWEEFHHNVFDQIRYHESEEHINGHDYLHPSRDVQSRKIVKSKAKFVELDKNHDW